MKEMLELKLANPFHKNVCAQCHPTLRDEEWLDKAETGRKYTRTLQPMAHQTVYFAAKSPVT